MSDLITPTGILLGAPEPRTSEWFALRRGGITATDLPLILGLTPKYGNALSVWMDKSGYDVPDVDNEPAYWGTLLEPTVADEWAERNGTPVHRVGVLANAEHQWQRASLDRLVETCPDGDGPCGLEIKTRSAFKSKLWGRDIPDDTLAQVLWQNVVSGFMHMHVAVLLGGQRMKSYRVDAEGNEDIIELLVERARWVWGCVEAGEQPEVDPDEGLERMLDALFPDRSGEVELPASRVADLLEAKAAHADAARVEAKLKAAWRAAVKEALQDKDTITVEGRPVIALRTVDRSAYSVPASSYQQVRVVGSLPGPDVDDDEMEEGDDDGSA